MASVNPIKKEIMLKIVYYGPGLGGKTSTLQHIHRAIQPEHRGKMVSLATPVDRTLYFDFLPIRLPQIGAYTLRLQMFTVPGQVHYNATRKLVLTGADGVVFVADSQESRRDANIESLDNLRDNLAEQKLDLDVMPFSLQYNKRDIKDICPIEDLERDLNKNGERPSIGTCAISGDGVFQGLEMITKEVLKDLKQQEILAQDAKVTAEKIESQIAFRKEQHGILRSLQEFSESSSQSIPRYGSEEPTATFPSIQKDSGPSITEDNKPGEPVSQTLEKKEPLRKEANRPVANPRQVRVTPPIKQTDMQGQSALVAESLSFSDLWPKEQRKYPDSIELAIKEQRDHHAIGAIWKELDRILTIAGEGLPDGSTERVIALLGLNGRQYLEVSRLSRAAQNKEEISRESLLRAYMYLLQAVSQVY